MRMNFFEHQEDARRRSRGLVIMFALAVAAFITAFYFFFAFIVTVLGPPSLMEAPNSMEEPVWQGPSLWQPRTLLWVSGITILLGGLACRHKISKLRAGGAAVARMLGASRVVVSSDRPFTDFKRSL